MIRFGCCALPDACDVLADAGFDFVELSSDVLLPGEPPSAFEPRRAELAAANLFPEVVSLTLPPEVRLVGRDSDRKALARLLRCTLSRAAEVGARLVIFGPGALTCLAPELPMASAWELLKRLLEAAAPVAARLGLDLALEPAPRTVSGMVNTLGEAWMLAEEVGQPNVVVACSLPHLLAEREGYEALIVAGPALRHVHVSDRTGRPPGQGGFRYEALFYALAQADFEGSLSIDAQWGSLEAEARPALVALREAARLSP